MNSKSEFLVIGAGLGRTGTMSLKNALEMILPGKCHHMTHSSISPRRMEGYFDWQNV